jgi:large subunit ribosomal protein L19
MAAKSGKSSAKGGAKPTAKKAAKAKAPKGSTGTDLVRRVTWDKISAKKALPNLQTGDTVGVYVKVKEGEKERVQLFTGVVIKLQGTGVSRSFTVRKIASGVGVERSFPMMSPIIDKVEVVSRGKVRRGRLFFLRGLKGRSARLDSEQYFDENEAPGAADEVAVSEEAKAEGAAPAEAAAPKTKPAKTAPKA